MKHFRSIFSFSIVSVLVVLGIFALADVTRAANSLSTPSNAPSSAQPVMDGPLVSGPVYPTYTIAVRDLPDADPSKIVVKREDRRKPPLSLALHGQDYSNIQNILDPLAPFGLASNSGFTPSPLLTWQGQ